MLLAEDLAVLGPAGDVDEGGEVVGDNNFGFIDIVNSSHTSQFGDGSFGCI